MGRQAAWGCRQCHSSCTGCSGVHPGLLPALLSFRFDASCAHLCLQRLALHSTHPTLVVLGLFMTPNFTAGNVLLQAHLCSGACCQRRLSHAPHQPMAHCTHPLGRAHTPKVAARQWAPRARGGAWETAETVYLSESRRRCCMPVCRDYREREKCSMLCMRDFYG